MPIPNCHRLYHHVSRLYLHEVPVDWPSVKDTWGRPRESQDKSRKSQETVRYWILFAERYARRCQRNKASHMCVLQLMIVSQCQFGQKWTFLITVWPSFHLIFPYANWSSEKNEISQYACSRYNHGATSQKLNIEIIGRKSTTLSKIKRRKNMRI